MIRLRVPVPRLAARRAVAVATALTLLPGCLTYEKSQTRITFDGKSGIAHVQTMYWNVASTEPGRREQWEDLEQLDSLRRSDPYFANSYLRSPSGGRIGPRRVWIEKGLIHASASVSTRDLNELAEGWSADSSGYRYTSNLEITATNGRRTDDEKPTVIWPKTARLLTVAERDPHFGEAVPFRAEIRDSLAKRLPPVVKPSHPKRATTHHAKRRARSRRSRTH
jgi:hypothetical protein